MTIEPEPRYLIGIGAQKAATSWVHASLAAQSGVCTATDKELDFFSARFDRGYGWYRAQWPSGATLRLEVSPSYLHDPRAPERLSRFAPNARLVLCLRDPVERAFSHHLHEIAKGHIAPQLFKDALDENPSYLSQGFYAGALADWNRCFGSGRLMILLTEEIAADPATALQRLCHHCQLPPPDNAPLAARNVSDHARSVVLRRALRSGGASLRRVGLGRLAEQLRDSGPLGNLRRWNERHLSQAVAPPDAHLRRILADHFAKDMLAIAEALGRNRLPWPSWDLAKACRATGSAADAA